MNLPGRRMGVGRPRVSDFDRKVMRNLRGFGLTYEEIVALTDFSFATVQRECCDVKPVPQTPLLRVWTRGPTHRKISPLGPKIQECREVPEVEEGGLRWPTPQQMMVGR